MIPKEPMPQEAETASAETEKPEPADGFSELGGLWEIGYIQYRNQTINVHDYESLESLYNTTYLSFQEDGTFLYINFYFYSGTYSRLQGSGSNLFLLKTDSVYRLEVQGNDYTRVEVDGSNPSYLAELSEDGNTITFCEYDAITGKAKANDDPLYFVLSEG